MNERTGAKHQVGPERILPVVGVSCLPSCIAWSHSTPFLSTRHIPRGPSRRLALFELCDVSLLFPPQRALTQSNWGAAQFPLLPEAGGNVSNSRFRASWGGIPGLSSLWEWMNEWIAQRWILETSEAFAKRSLGWILFFFLAHAQCRTSGMKTWNNLFSWAIPALEKLEASQIFLKGGSGWEG